MDASATSWSTQQLTEFLADVAGIPEETALLQRAVERATEALDADAGALVCTQGVVATYGFPRHKVPTEELETIAFWGASSGLDVPGVGPCAVLVVPCDEMPGGRLVLARSGTDFTSEERGLVRGIARVLSLSLLSVRMLERERTLRDHSEQQAAQNAQLLESLRERQGLLERLARLQRSISAGRPLDEVLDAIVAGVRDLLGDPVATLRLLDPDDPSYMYTAAHVGVSERVAALVAHVPVATGNASGRAILEDRLVVAEEYAGQPGSLQVMVNDGVTAAMAVPVHQRGSVVGALVVASREPGRRYSESERDVLLALAEHAGLALNDARLVGALQRAVEDATHQALHDPLTGLPNRALFLDRLDHARLRAERSESSVVVLFVDVDNFKLVNDSLGHARGDELLRLLGHRIADVLRAGDTVARLGGDEFAVLLEDTRVETGTETAMRIRDALAVPFALGGRQVFVTASIGVVSTADSSHSADELLHDADVAMYRAKSGGRARHVVFEPEMRRVVQERSALAADLREAVRDGGIELHYQPIVALASGAAVGLEALARWQHPTRGWVRPEDFIALAEETGLIVELGTQMLREACRQAAAWRAHGQELVVGVNVSARQIQEESFVTIVADALADSGLPPEGLSLEVTESLLLGDLTGSVARLREVQGLGVRVALDDFGTGYSSLSYLSRLPVDLFKVDKSFVAGLGVSENDETVVRAVLSLGHSLGLATVAEGVETDAQVIALIGLGCDYGQGYRYSRPLRPGDVPAAVKALAANRPVVPTPRRASDDRPPLRVVR